MKSGEEGFKPSGGSEEDAIRAANYLEELLLCYWKERGSRLISMALASLSQSIPLEVSDLLSYVAERGEFEEFEKAWRLIPDSQKLKILEGSLRRAVSQGSFEELGDVVVRPHGLAPRINPADLHRYVNKIVELDAVILLADLTGGVVFEERPVHRFLASHGLYRFILEFTDDLASRYHVGDRVTVTGLVMMKKKALTVKVLCEEGWLRDFKADWEGVKIKTCREPLRHVFKFSSIEPFHVESEAEIEDGELVDRKIHFRLFLARMSPGEPPYLLIDYDGFVNARRYEYSLRVARREEIDEILKHLPPSLIREAEKSGLLSRAFVPVQRLRDPSILRRIDWTKIVENIINPRGAVRYTPLLIVRRATLLRGIKQGCNPHSIIVLPSQVGKSEWYEKVGICVDKASAKGLIGFADVNGVRYGSLHESELPYAIDQLEEQDADAILRYLFNLMEFGEALVDNAGFRFQVCSDSTIVLLSNPLGAPKNDFALLLSHLSRNTALGRRFGIILYDSDRPGYMVPRVERREYDLGLLISEDLALFRAVEDYARANLRAIVKSSWSWLNSQNDEWIKQAMNLISTLNDQMKNVRDFLENYVCRGWSHIRGAALYAAIADSLDSIALGSFDLNDLLRSAEEYLDELLQVIYNSLANIVEAVGEKREELILRVYDTAPGYLKEIINAVEYLKRQLAGQGVSTPVTVSLKTLNYKPSSPRYGYFSEVLRDARKSNPLRYNERLAQNFGFRLLEKDSELFAEILSLEPSPINLPNNLGALGNLGDLGAPLRADEAALESHENGIKPAISPPEKGVSFPENLSKIPKAPKIHKAEAAAELRLVCHRCLEDVRKISSFIEVVAQRYDPNPCEFCGESPSEYIARFKVLSERGDGA